MSRVYEGGFPEGLRWHRGELWLSDMRRRTVVSIDSAGRQTVRAFVPGQPSGLGWRPDGELLISSMLDGHLILQSGDRLSVAASPGRLSSGPLNDMVVDAHGRAYVGSLGFDPTYADLESAELGPHALGSKIDYVPLILVHPSGEMTIAADHLAVPNGIVLIDAGSTLVVAETLLARLTAFAVRPDGSLTARRTFAQLDAPVDGICADREGAIWASQLMDERYLRVADGGEVLDEVRTHGLTAVDCVLGGADGTTLFAAVVDGPLDFWSTGSEAGAVETYRVAVGCAVA